MATSGKEQLQNPLNIQYDLKNNFIKNETAPSLEHIALTTIAISLFKNKNIENVVPDKVSVYNSFKPYNRFLREVEIIEESVSTLQLPKDLQKVLKIYVRKIGDEIERFLFSVLQMSFAVNYEKVSNVSSIKWTARGTINSVKTVKFWLENCNFNRFEKHVLICHYCLTENINDLNIKLPQYVSYARLYLNTFNILHSYSHQLLQFSEPNEYYKIYKIYDIYNKPINPVLLKWAIRSRNDAALQYVWENYSLFINISQFMKLALECKISTNAVFYLISKSSKNNETENLFIEHGYHLLNLMAQDQRWHEYLINTTIFVIKLIPRISPQEKLENIATLIASWNESEDLKPHFRVIMNDCEPLIENENVRRILFLN